MALAVVLAFYLLLIGIWAGKGVLGSDFAILYSSARGYFAGQSIYAPVPLDRYQPVSPQIVAQFGRDTFLPNLNPPFQTLLFLPLGLLDIHKAYLVFALFSLGCALLAAGLLRQVRPRPFGDDPYLPGVVLLAFAPSILVFSEGQVTFPVLLLLAGSWLLARQGREAPAGVLLGLAVSLKPFTGLLVLLFLLGRRWKLLGWCVGTFLAANLLALAAFGAGAYQEYRQALASIDWYSFEWNASLRGYFTRLAALVERPLPVDALVWLCSALAVGLFLWAAWRARGGGRAADLAWMVGLAVMLLVSPLGWIYYFPLLFLPLAVLLQEGRVGGSHRMALLAGGLWAALAVWPLLPKSDAPAVFTLLQAGFYTYALVGVALLPAWRLRFTSPSPAGR